MPTRSDLDYCHRCGTELEADLVAGGDVTSCPSCGHALDPDLGQEHASDVDDVDRLLRSAPVGRCRAEACRARIRFVVTRLGNAQPIDADPNPSGNIVLTGDRSPANGTPIVETLGPLDFADTRTRFMPHHATCLDAGHFAR